MKSICSGMEIEVMNWDLPLLNKYEAGNKTGNYRLIGIILVVFDIEHSRTPVHEETDDFFAIIAIP